MTNNAHIEKKRLENPPAKFKLKIQRREKQDAAAYWETFELPYRRNLNVISVLMEIRKNPVTVDLRLKIALFGVIYDDVS